MTINLDNSLDNGPTKTLVMYEHVTADLIDQAERIVALSMAHLTLATRQKLVANDLSVNAHSSPQGGFIYVGSPPYDIPAEADLARIFEMAGRAGVAWLKFDDDSAIIDGLPTFEPLPEDF